jgi:DcaP outer membrane protein
MWAQSKGMLYAAAAITLACMQCLQAQTPSTPDLQVLKAKLQQLEQEMQGLKSEIEAMEQSQPNQLATAVGELVSPPPPPTENAKASTEQEKLEDKIDLYGFVMLDSGYDFKTNNPDWFDVDRPTKLPAFPGEFAPDGKVYLGVRQTRFGVKTATPTPLGDLKTQFEFELFGTGVDAGQTTFRLRHAYGELGPFGAGQTWSAFMDIDVFPNSLEYWGPNGMVFFRNVQFRWMPIRKAGLHLMFAAERPGASADQGIYAGRIELQNITPQFPLPDFSWQLRVIREWGYVQAARIFRKISWVDTGTGPYNLSDTVLGWGVNTSSNLKFGSNSVGRLQVVYGRGIENYMNDAPIDIGIENNFSNPVSPIKWRAAAGAGRGFFSRSHLASPLHQHGGVLDGEYLELGCGVTVGFSPGILCACESALSPDSKGHDGRRVSIRQACEFQRCIQRE